jgi:hypothetical protein
MFSGSSLTAEQPHDEREGARLSKRKGTPFRGARSLCRTAETAALPSKPTGWHNPPERLPFDGVTSRTKNEPVGPLRGVFHYSIATLVSKLTIARGDPWARLSFSTATGDISATRVTKKISPYANGLDEKALI